VTGTLTRRFIDSELLLQALHALDDPDVQSVLDSDSLEEASLKVLQLFDEYLQHAIDAALNVQDNRNQLVGNGGPLVSTRTNLIFMAADIGD
jgi:hypothetical protein